MKFFAVVLLFIISSCSSTTPTSDNYDRVAGFVNRQIRQEISVYVAGFGAMIPKKIHAYAMMFEHQGPIPVPSGRDYVLRMSHIALESFNSDNAIQEYLENRPFSVKNLAFSIYSSTWFNYDAPEGFVDVVGFSYGRISYKRYNHVTEKFEILFTETFEEALQKCQSFNQPSSL